MSSAAGRRSPKSPRTYGMTTGDLMRLNGIEQRQHDLDRAEAARLGARRAVAPAPSKTRRSRQVADDDPRGQGGRHPGESHRPAYRPPCRRCWCQRQLPNPNFVYTGQQLRVRPRTQPPILSTLVAAPADGKRGDRGDLTNQTLTAWQGDVMVMHHGHQQRSLRHAHCDRAFRHRHAYKAQRMTGPGYDLPNVPWVMYFHRQLRHPRRVLAQQLRRADESRLRQHAPQRSGNALQLGVGRHRGLCPLLSRVT
jgi:hypothetical protein